MSGVSDILTVFGPLIESSGFGRKRIPPELLADQIVYAIDQPWGVSISDLTVRAPGDVYVI